MVNKIKISNPIIEEEEINAVKRVLKSGVLTKGPETKKFEEAFANYIGCEYAIATSNGTTALHTALLANNIGKGDEVITPSFSFIASANSILYTGAKPIFTDVSHNDFNVDPIDIESKITKKTKALVVVHLYGQPCDMKPILEICDKYNIVLIEDACQAHGAKYYNKNVGSFSAGCFSFYATKNMTTGEGGMITTNNKRIAEKTKMLINHGSKKNYENTELGFNFRMTEFQAAIGYIQLTKLDKLNSIRIKNAELYTKLFNKVKELETPKIFINRKHVFHQYTVKIDENKRGVVISNLEKNNIGYGIYYPKPIHKQNLYIELGYRDKLPVSERLSKEVLSLPVHPGVTKTDIKMIVESIKCAV